MAVIIALAANAAGSAGVGNDSFYSTVVVKAAVTENGQQARAGGIDILNYEDNASAAEFVVNDIAGFEKIAELVNSGMEDFSGKTITLNADLEYDKSVENNHTVIGGDYSRQFDGIFDGGFHTISGVNLNSDVIFTGLFGITGKNARITKIILEDSQIISKGSPSSSKAYYVGGIVGGPCEGFINECISGKNVEVIGGTYTSTGGIAGYSYGNISRCINFAAVKGDCAGGIVGAGRYDIEIKECINYGTISGISSLVQIGGICGSGGEAVECCNLGNILSEKGVSGVIFSVGGITGQDGKAVNCYNEGQAIGADRLYVGGIIGSGSSSNKIVKNSYSVGEVKNGYPGAITSIHASHVWELSNCYWLTGTAPDGVCETGRGEWTEPPQDTSSVFEYSRTQMISQDFVDELNANSKSMGYDEVWAADTKNINNGYPVLKNVPYTIEDLKGSNLNYNGFEYKMMENGTIGILKYHGTGSNEMLEIPAQIDGIRVTDILDSAFADCTGLTEITIPDSVTVIGYHAFYGCSSLTDVYYGGTKEQWSAIAVEAASGLEDEKITIHYSGGDETAKDYEYIDIGFIEGTIAITKYLGSDAEVTIPSEIDGKTVGKISISAFESENLKKVVIPASVTTIPCFAFSNCPNLAVIEVDSANESYTAEDGVLFNKEKTELLQCPEGKSGTYTVPSGVVLLEYSSFHSCKKLDMIIVPDGVTKIGNGAFAHCTKVTDIVLPKHMDEMGTAVFENCSSLRKISVPEGLKELNYDTFLGCSSLAEVEIPKDAAWIKTSAFGKCDSLKSLSIPDNVIKISYGAFGLESEKAPLEDIYYGGTREQWEKIEVQGGLIEEGSTSEKLELDGVAVHFKDSPIVLPEEPLQPAVRNPKEELESLKSADPFSLEKDFSHYLTAEQMDILESYLFTWLAEVNYAYWYSGSSTVKELVMKKAGIDPQGDFASGMEQAITHVSVKTPFGIKTFEITMGLGKTDGSGNLYPGYSVMHYEVLEKGGIPSEVPKSGQIVRNYYTDMGPFVQSVKKAAEDSLHGTYQWESLEDAVTAGILVDKNVSEIVGNRNGSFSDGTFTIFAEPLFAYSKIVHIACPVDVHVYSMDGKEAGSIVNDKPSGGNQNVRLDTDGDTKTVYLAGDDYYLNLRGTGTGTMTYEVEEVANEDVQRTVQFLELQLKDDMQYEGYVFRPLNIDRDMYALRTVEKDGTGGEIIRADKDSYQASFKKVQEISLSQKNTSLESDRTVQLSASHFPLDASNPNLRWTTDNESVARVDENGLVTAVGSGRATVTVSTKDGSFLRQFCVIDVAGKDNGSDNTGGDNSGGSTDGNGSGSGAGGNGSGSGTGGSSSGGTGSSSAGGSSSGNSGQQAGQQPSVVKVHYVIQFNLNGGTKLSRKTMTLLSGDIPGIMPKAQRKDYIFDGWYTQQDGGEKVSGDKPLDAAATLYARWAKALAPAKPAALTLQSKKKGQIQAGFQKVNGADGYQIEYSANKNFASAKTGEAKASAKTKTVTGLKAGKKYYVRVRAYCVDSVGNRIYGAYSTAKSIRTKK